MWEAFRIRMQMLMLITSLLIAAYSLEHAHSVGEFFSNFIGAHLVLIWVIASCSPIWGTILVLFLIFLCP